MLSLAVTAALMIAAFLAVRAVVRDEKRLAELEERREQ
jgi:hypothetical protein